jgi:lysophospholipase
MMSEYEDPQPAGAFKPPLIPSANGEEGHFSAADGTKIRYKIWPAHDANRRGGVILLPGRSEFIEKYSETVQDLLDRGFWVAAMDWRGQGLSGRPLSNRHKHHLTSFAPMADDLEQFLNELEVLDLARPRIILAHSMGAHVALRFLHDHPAAVDGAVLSAPMVALTFAPFGRRLIRTITSLAMALGLGKLYAPGQTNYGTLQRSGANMRILTSDPERFRAEHRWIAQNPDLALGGVTYGWLDAAMASIGEINANGYAEAIKTPLLVVQAGADRLIDNPRQEAFARRLPNAKFLKVEGARHEILNERDEYRDQFLAAFDRQAEGWLPQEKSADG